MDINEIRYNNLKCLIDECGSAERLAALAGTSAAYLSQIITKRKNPGGKTRKIGDKLARKLEDGTKKKQGWMDKDRHEITSTKNSNFNYDGYSILKISASQLAKADLSKGIEVIYSMDLSTEFIPKKIVKDYGKENLLLVEIQDNSMSTIIKKGDLVVCCFSIMPVEESLILWRNDSQSLVVREYRASLSGYRVYPSNKAYIEQYVDNDKELARIIGVIVGSVRYKNFM